ncbi:MAG TPA: thioredoxin domain-containing protein [Terriglobales bacterium]|nr:thioredoxin domain-containing protein [Terriglobales bacterium]
MSLLKRPLWLMILFCLGCSAQPAQSPTADVNHRIERTLRAHYNVPDTIGVSIGERKPSEFPGYDQVQVIFTEGTHRTPNDFLVSQDGKTLIRMTKMDLSADPYADTMKKIAVAGRPVRGARDSKVAVVVYDDFQCPFCSRMHETLFREVFNDYKDRIHVVYKDYPLFSIHPWAGRAANDANCLAEMNNDAFWDYADALHLNPEQVTGPRDKRRGMPEQMAAVDVLAFQAGAKRGVNEDKLQACIKAQSDKTVQESVHEADALGVSATPTLFVNGRKLEGAVDAAGLRAALNAALRDAGQPVPSPEAATAPANK